MVNAVGGEAEVRLSLRPWPVSGLGQALAPTVRLRPGLAIAIMMFYIMRLVYNMRICASPPVYVSALPYICALLNVYILSVRACDVLYMHV